MAARFGDMLLEQRRRMGLSIQQVANTIKIRPQIIEFFETGNFASMPPRGYAQGMISSYARFLGLNPREVVNAYFDDLMAYERETSQQGGRFQDAAGYVNSRSSVDNGRFLMVQAVVQPAMDSVLSRPVILLRRVRARRFVRSVTGSAVRRCPRTVHFPLPAAWLVTLVPATATAAIPIAVTVGSLLVALAVAMRMPIPRR